METSMIFNIRDFFLLFNYLVLQYSNLLSILSQLILQTILLFGYFRGYRNRLFYFFCTFSKIMGISVSCYGFTWKNKPSLGLCLPFDTIGQYYFTSNIYFYSAKYNFHLYYKSRHMFIVLSLGQVRLGQYTLCHC